MCVVGRILKDFLNLNRNLEYASFLVVLFYGSEIFLGFSL